MGVGSHNGPASQEILQAVLLAIRDGLSLLQVFGYKKAEVESDSLEAVRLISMGVVASHPLWAIIMDIRNMLEREEQYCIKHIFREANSAADFIAKLGHGHSHSGEKLLPSPPAGLVAILDRDMVELLPEAT